MYRQLPCPSPTVLRSVAGSFLPLLLLALLSAAIAQETDLSIHDPSTLIRRGDTYWVFGTGLGCPAFSSTDRVHWTFRGPVLPEPPAWTRTVTPRNPNGHFWAPDVRYVRGRYLLYYAVSTFGSHESAIGLAASRTLEPGSWTDEGVVIQSTGRDDFNAIDPCVTESRDGRLWLGFGSFWSGIKLVELDPATGKRIGTSMESLARHPQDRADSIEAPFICSHGGYYYLFVNWDYCCRGARSTYNIRVGRSRRITGPYVDRQGLPLLQGGGTLVLGSHPDDGSGRPFDPRIGPGHAGILSDEGVDRFSFHYEYVRDRGGRPTLQIGAVRWDSAGWPTVTPPN